MQTLTFNEYIQNEINIYGIPGMGLAVSKNGKMLYKNAIGYRDIENNIPMEPDCHWGIASCSKAFTAVLALIMVDKGMLDLDKPIKEYLSDFAMYDKEAEQNCTMRDMLAHRTGLGNHDSLWMDHGSREDLFHRLQFLKPAIPFRSEMLYNNTIYTLAGYIEERISGIPWETMIEEWIFKPLNMNSSASSLSKISEFENAATPYWNYDGHLERMAFGDIRPGEPCAGIVTCLDDAIKWLDFNARKGKDENGKQLVSEGLMKEAYANQIDRKIWPWENEIDELPIQGCYGLGWFSCVYRGHRMVFHQGEIEGYCTMFGYMPDDELCVATYVNMHKPATLPMTSVMYNAFDKVLGLPEVNWSEYFQSKIGDYRGMYEHWKCDLTEEMDYSDDSEEGLALSEYIGSYENEGYGIINIIEEDGIKAVFRGIKQDMQKMGGNRFKIIDMLADTLLITFPVEFIVEKSLNGKCEVTGFYAKPDPGTEKILFKRKQKEI